MASTLDSSRFPSRTLFLLDLIRVAAGLHRAEAERDLARKLFKPLRDFNNFLHDVVRERTVIGHAARLFLDVDGPSKELQRISKVLDKEDAEDIGISSSQIRDLSRLADGIKDVVLKGTDLGRKVLKYYGGDIEKMKQGYDKADVKRLSDALDLDSDVSRLLSKYLEDEEAWFDLAMLGKGNVVRELGSYYDNMVAGLIEGADLLESMDQAKAA